MIIPGRRVCTYLVCNSVLEKLGEEDVDGMWLSCALGFADDGNLDYEAARLEKYQKELKKQLRMLDAPESATHARAAKDVSAVSMSKVGF